jgi:hypothetical protein
MRVQADVPANIGKSESDAPGAALCKADEGREVACGQVAGNLCEDPNAHMVSVEWAGFYAPASQLEPEPWMGGGESNLSKRTPFRFGQPSSIGMGFDAKRTGSYNPVSPQRHTKNCCYSRCTKVTPGTAGPLPDNRPQDKSWLVSACLEFDVPHANDVRGTRCVPSVRQGNKDLRFIKALSTKQCCYGEEVFTPASPQPLRGRPLREGWAARVAELVPSSPGDAVVSSELSPSALRWAADAALEHSSIAAFAKLSLDLMAHGAPLDLVRAAHQAALEEIRHTEAACAMATAAGYPPSAPGPIPMTGFALSSLVEILETTIWDGCLGEGVAAIEAECASAEEPDAQTASLLATIAKEEAGHAELAFRVVGFALRKGGDAERQHVHDICTQLAELAGTGDSLRHRVARDIVMPGLQQYLGAYGAQTRDITTPTAFLEGPLVLPDGGSTEDQASA